MTTEGWYRKPDYLLSRDVALDSNGSHDGNICFSSWVSAS